MNRPLRGQGWLPGLFDPPIAVGGRGTGRANRESFAIDTVQAAPSSPVPRALTEPSSQPSPVQCPSCGLLGRRVSQHGQNVNYECASCGRFDVLDPQRPAGGGGEG